MAEVLFTSTVSYGDTEEVRPQSPNVDERPYLDEDNREATLYVVYVRGVGEFSSTDRAALADLFETLAAVTRNKDNVPSENVKSTDSGNTWIDECDGHETLSGAHMGETIYCDGRCKG